MTVETLYSPIYSQSALKDLSAYEMPTAQVQTDQIIQNLRLPHFALLTLFFEVLKLTLKDRELSRLARMEERQLQLQKIQQVSDTYKQAGNWLLFSSIGAGILGIVSGIAPIVGHVKGESILNTFKGVISGLKDVKKEEFFNKTLPKVTAALSKMQESTGQVQKTFCDGSIAHDQHMSEINKTDWEEETRTMDEGKDNWKNVESFLHQTLQMYHDAIRQLYNG